jgi:low affinity Fe/Cu permease
VKKYHYRKSKFANFASQTAHYAGHPATFTFALGVIVGWACTGPLFQYSDTWQLVINTGTTIVTFLMVFLIQNSQNRDGHAMQLKLDELIRASNHAHNALLDVEELSVDDLVKIKTYYARLAAAARENVQKGKADTGVVDIKFGKHGVLSGPLESALGERETD